MKTYATAKAQMIGKTRTQTCPFYAHKRQTFVPQHPIICDRKKSATAELPSTFIHKKLLSQVVIKRDNKKECANGITTIKSFIMLFNIVLGKLNNSNVVDVITTS